MVSLPQPSLLSVPCCTLTWSSRGYPEDRTAGLLVIAGGLGPGHSPSIIMVLYCTLTGASVTNMFSQGMVIGILIMIVLILEASVLCSQGKVAQG